MHTLLAWVVLLFPWFPVSAEAQEPPPLSELVVASQPSAEPVLTAYVALAVDLTAEAELWSRNADDPWPPASTAKIITALTVRRLLTLDELVRIEPEDLVDPLIYANAGLQPGDELMVRDLLAAMLVASAGDAARALARVAGTRISGAVPNPVNAFVASMNEEAQRLGLRRSRFLSPDGRDVAGQVTSARDLALATKYLLSDPVLASLITLPQVTLTVSGPSARTITLQNTNQALGWDSVIGGKTGTTVAAGQCLVLVVSRGGTLLVLVLLGSTDRYADARALLTWLDTHYRWVTLSANFFPALESLRAQGITPALVPTLLLTAEEATRVTLIIERDTSSAGWIAGAVGLRIGNDERMRIPLILSARRGKGTGFGLQEWLNSDYRRSSPRKG